MQDKKRIKVSEIIAYAVCIAALAGAAFVIYAVLGAGIYDMASLLVCLVFSQIMIVFSYAGSAFKNLLAGNNASHRTRFYIWYAVCIVCSVAFSFMPVSVWPYVAVFALLTFLSNIPTGILAASSCLLISIYAEGSGAYSYLVLYLFCGIFASVLLSFLDREFKVVFPIVSSELMLIAALCAMTFVTGDGITPEKLIFPGANAALTLILLLIVIKIYADRVLTSEVDMYAAINDPECELMTKLKESNPREYFKSVHVAYFCDRVAKETGMDGNKLKCAGYYHRVGTIKGDNSWEAVEPVLDENNIPPEVKEILKEFLDEKEGIHKPETAVLFMSECIVSSILYLFGKDKNMKLDLASLTEAIFKQRIDTGMFRNCDISIRQFEEMKKVFVEEKLYYDFLR